MKRLREVAASVWETLKAEFRGTPSIEVEHQDRVGGEGRYRAERPARAFGEFAFVSDIMTNSTVEYGVAKLARDATVDENGDERGWSVTIKVDPREPDDYTDTEALVEAYIAARRLRRELQHVADALVERAELGAKTKGYIRKMLEAGDCFAEVDIEIDERGAGHIRGVRELPTWQMFPIWDTRGRVVGYRQQPSSKRDPVLWPVPVQVLHWRNDPCDYFKFGRSVLLPLRANWEQFKLLEHDLYAAIHSRSVAPEVHYLGRESAFHEVSDEEIRKYRRKLLEDPTDINRFYVVKNGQTRIDVLRSDSEAVRVLADAYAQMEGRMLLNLGVPLAIAGAQGDTQNRHHAAVQRDDYARRINAIRADFTAVLQKLFRLEFRLRGYTLDDPARYGVDRISIEFRWPNLAETPAARSTRLQSEYASRMKSLQTVLYEAGVADPEGEIALMRAEEAMGLRPTAHIAPPTPNGEEGRGVPSEPGAPGQDSNKVRDPRKRNQPNEDQPDD